MWHLAVWWCFLVHGPAGKTKKLRLPLVHGRVGVGLFESSQRQRPFGRPRARSRRDEYPSQGLGLNHEDKVGSRI